MPSVAQAEMLQQFLEENTELVLATGDIEREKSTEISPKWESIAAELNPLGDSDTGENQTPVFWAQVSCFGIQHNLLAKINILTYFI